MKLKNLLLLLFAVLVVSDNVLAQRVTLRNSLLDLFDRQQTTTAVTTVVPPTAKPSSAAVAPAGAPPRISLSELNAAVITGTRRPPVVVPDAVTTTGAPEQVGAGFNASPIRFSEISVALITGRRRPASTQAKNESDSELALNSTDTGDTTEQPGTGFNADRIRLSELNVNLITGRRRPASNQAKNESDSERALTGDESADTATATIMGSFDCRRNGHDCDPNGGMCDLDSGVCTCVNDYTAFTCELEVNATVNASLCNDGLGCGSDADAFCVKSGETGRERYTCLCPYHLYGDSCEKPRYQLQCTSSSMLLRIAPYGVPDGFKGQLFVIDSANSTKVDNSACTFSPSNDGVFTLRVPYDDIVDKCGGQSLDNDSHELRFAIQADPEWLVVFDQIVTARCTVAFTQMFQKTVIVQASSAVTGENGTIIGLHISNDLDNVNTGLIEAERMRVEFIGKMPRPVLSILKEDGDIITGSVKIGDVIIFKIENVADLFYTAMRAEDCTLKMDDMLSALLLKDQCPASRFAWSLFQWSKTEITETSLAFHMRLPANAMTGRPRQVTISCHVRLCAEDVVEMCAASEDNCKNTIQSLMAAAQHPTRANRKRRSEFEEDSSMKIVTVEKTIDLDYDEPEIPGRKKYSSQSSSSATSIHVSFGLASLLLATKWLF